MMEYLEKVQGFLTPESVNEALRTTIFSFLGFAGGWIWRRVVASFSMEQQKGEICKSVLELLAGAEKMNPLPEERENSLIFAFLDIKIRVYGMSHFRTKDIQDRPPREGQLASVLIGERDAYPHLSKTERLSIQVAYHDAVRRLREAKAKREQAAILHSLTSLEKNR